MNVRPWTGREALNSDRARGVVLSLLLVSSLITAGFATSQHEVFRNAVPFVANDLKGVKGLDQGKAMLDNPSAAKELINRMREIQGDNACPLTQNELKQKSTRDTHCLPDLDDKHPDTYVVVHLLRWSDSSTAEKPKVETDHWYVYRDTAPGKWSQEDFSSAKRLLGVKKVYVLLVHLNALQLIPGGTVSYTPDYDFTITKKTPANIAHLYALLQAYTGGASSGQATPGKKLLAPTPDAVWGGGVVNLQYRPSDILIKSTFRVKSDDPDQKLADDTTLDNEGPYYWDIGFAVPIKKISELKLDSTSGTATPAQVNSQNVFAVFDGYIRPVDVNGSGFTAIPHPIAGVAFAKQPLHKILIGGAWGPKVSEIYLGAMFVKQPELSGNSSCSNPSGASFTGKSHYCTQFTIGINLSVSAIASKLGAPK